MGRFQFQKVNQMGFLDKMKNKIENAAADKIVDKMFGKQKKDAEEEVIRQQQAVIEEQQRQIAEQQAAQMQAAQTEQQAVHAQAAEPQVVYVNNGAPAQAGRVPDAAEMEKLMGMAYNTKRCPNCQAVCVNSPVECPYCHADLKGVKPMTPEELEALE